MNSTKQKANVYKLYRKWESREGKGLACHHQSQRAMGVCKIAWSVSQKLVRLAAMKLRKIEHAASVDALGNANHSI